MVLPALIPLALGIASEFAPSLIRRGAGGLTLLLLLRLPMPSPPPPGVGPSSAAITEDTAVRSTTTAPTPPTILTLTACR